MVEPFYLQEEDPFSSYVI